MTIKFLLLVNKQGQTRLSSYYGNDGKKSSVEERSAFEAELIRKCLSRNEYQCSITEHQGVRIVYRRYASLFFILGISEDENELAALEFVHLLVESLDRFYENVCELDIMFNLEKSHFILDEMVMNGCIVETNKTNILSPIQLLDKHS